MDILTFQFLIGSMKVSYTRLHAMTYAMFQFLIGSMKDTAVPGM